MRVHELAKELNVASRDLLIRLHALEIEARNNMSPLEDAEVARLREDVRRAPIVPEPPPPPKVIEVKAPPMPEPPPEPKPEPEPAPAPELVAEATPVPAPAPEAPPAVADVAPPPPAKPEAKPKPEARTAPVKSPPPPAPVVAPPPVKPAAPAAPARIQAPVRPTAPAAPAAPVALVELVTEGDRKILRVRGVPTVRELAQALTMRPNRIVTELMAMKVLASINARVEPLVVRKIAEAHGYEFEAEKRPIVEHVAPRKKAVTEETDADADEDLAPRPPVVTFMGHVDHGKTSLLDKIRNATVAAGEHGGITQHIGAYTVDVDGRQITFLDTPGHAAFTAMRARGANLTDITVIVIAADDGIMPQTREALKHAQAAGVTIMVAINKTDLPAANPDRVRGQLQEMGLTPEEWGGTTICCPVSATTGDGIDHLLEMILLQSDVLELKSNPKRRATGYVIEARLEPGMGPTANLLVKRGTLKVGDAIQCGRHWGRVRALMNDHGVKIKSAGPSTPVKCLGLSGVPEAGAEFKVHANDRTARDLAEKIAAETPRENVPAPQRVTLATLFDRLKESEKLELNVILKADTQGSVEAIAHALNDIKSDKVTLNLLLSGTGNITSNDVMLASASNAVILGFHVAREAGVDALSKHEGVEVRLHQIIYELLDQVRDAMAGLLAPEIREKVLGQAEIRQIFTVGKNARVAGCMIVRGNVTSRSRVRVRRGKEVLAETTLESLRHFQNDVSELREGQECGIRLVRYTGFEAGDTLEFYELEEIRQTL